MPLQAFLNLADSVGCLRLGQRLRQVSDVIEDPGPLSPILRLICAADSIQTLADWSQDEPQLRPWHRLGEKLWHASHLLQRFPSIDYGSDVVSEVYEGDLPTMYLPAMAATETPSEDVSFAGWLRRLKLWILIRAVTAAEDGHIFENGIRLLCRDVRLACDEPDLDRLDWLSQLSEGAGHLTRAEFEAGISIAGARLKGTAEAGFRALINRLAHVSRGEWRVDKETAERIPTNLG